MFEDSYPLQNFDFLKCRKMTTAILNIVNIIPIYARVPHSGLFVLVVTLASTSFAMYNIKLATIVQMCLCLKNKQITKIIVIIEII